MKKASTLVSAMITVVMLLGALGVGFSVKEFRVHRAEKAALAKVAPKAKEPAVRAALPGGERRRPEGPAVVQRGERSEQQGPDAERFRNMTDEERQQAMSQRTERFGGGRRGESGGRGPGMGMSDEERQAMRERFENMSEEERAQFREEMRQRSGNRRRGDRGAGPGGAQDGGLGRGEEGERTGEENQENPPEN